MLFRKKIRRASGFRNEMDLVYNKGLEGYSDMRLRGEQVALLLGTEDSELQLFYTWIIVWFLIADLVKLPLGRLYGRLVYKDPPGV